MRSKVATSAAVRYTGAALVLAVGRIGQCSSLTWLVTAS